MEDGNSTNVKAKGAIKDPIELLEKVEKDLNELNLSAPGVERGSSSREHQESSERRPRETRSGPLHSYHRGTAIRMLTDYIQDLRTLNTSLDENLQKQVEDYDSFLTELIGANQRDPNSALTMLERSKLKSMLKDYQQALEELTDALDEEDRHVVRDDHELIPILQEDEAHELPLYLSEQRFMKGEHVESLTTALDVCTTKLQEFKNMLAVVKIYRHQCNYLVETLEPVAINNFDRYSLALSNLLVQGIGNSEKKRNCANFCYESLLGLARKFQSVVDLFKMCASQDMHKSALRLCDVPPPTSTRRWSEFSLTIQNCEWWMDLVELAFYTLEKLLADPGFTLKDVSFKWSEEKSRMVLQIPGKQERQEGKSVLDVCKVLEDKDRIELTRQLVEMTRTENDEPWKFARLLSKAKYSGALANFLSLKLAGPTPQSSYLPSSFNVEPSTLKFKEYLDSGSSGMVAKSTWLGEQVAVKSVRSPALDRSKFEEEAAILATVQHPNVVRLIGFGFIDKNRTGLLVMELMDHDLRTVIDNRIRELGPGSCPFPTIVALDIILQIAQAMKHLRDLKVLHRDLKAKNILVNICKPLNTNPGRESSKSLMQHSTVLPSSQDTYVAKLSDFGLAKCRPEVSWVTTRMAGTTGWRAPEVFHVQDTEVAPEYKWPADVYSFAMTCYEILTGLLPFIGCPNGSIHEKVMRGERPPFPEKQDIPEILKGLINKCWATDPDDRPTFDEIVRLLWECRVQAILPVFQRHMASAVSRTPSVKY
ncbi:uncharacterized protein [Physcomitrium patens]|nr:uncharacterized protein LOC112280603 isoform X2 [Physcomitrium patens]PNR57111.1 hypothetical protein PHYPA_004104 [Physcomitrium patens]|eukprot:XP_024372021.1 uncharacterized protein LOC112280603 isoform X2 [Physcomitrella patens]